MGETPPRDVTIRQVEDSVPDDRAARLTGLLATGIERWLRNRASVDFGRDMSVHPDMGTERRPW